MKNELKFGSLAKEEFDAEYLRLIQADIADAQAHLDELPESQRRGLTLETYRHFNCGYLPGWVHSKSRAEFACGLYVDKLTGKPKRLPPPSERIIIPTAGGKHFNAAATPCARRTIKKRFWKQHASEKELFCDPDALNAELIVVVEGEFDVMSIWQASQGKIAVVATLGCGAYKNTLLPRLHELKEKKFLILFDADDARKDAKDFREELIGRGCPAVSKTFFDDALPQDDKKYFGQKVDANDILKQKGDAYLNALLERIIKNVDFEPAQAQIAELQKNPFGEGTEPNIAVKHSKNRNTTPTTRNAPDADNQKRELPPEIQSLVDRINNISAAELTGKGYLEHSANGASAPNGYICPWCGSGTGKNKTGALTWYDAPNDNHVCCHKCNRGGNVVGLLSVSYNIDCRGAEFYKLIRRAADEFGIEYDPKIFEYRPAPPDDLPPDFMPCDVPDDREDFIWTRDRIKSCPVNLRLPTGFEFNLRGITQIIPPKKENGDTKRIKISSPIVPTKKFRSPATGKLEYEFAILSDGEWYRIEIENKALSDPRAITALADKGGVILEPKLLCRFLDEVIDLNPDTIPRSKSYNQTGWTTDDCDEFAYPTPEFNAVIRRPGYDYERIFKPKGDPDAWKQKFVEVTNQGGAVARVVIGAACAASLVRPLELPNLQVHIWGAKSIGKTPLQKFAVSICGDPKFGALTHSFAATPKSRLETAAAFRDLPLIFDELESLSKRDAEKLPEDIYNYYLGISGEALKKDGTRRDPKLFSGARLTSGEHPINRQSSNGGQLKRVLDIHATKLFEENFASSLYGFCNRNHGLFGAKWIRYITDNRELIAEHYHKAFAGIKAIQVAREQQKNDTQMQTLVIAAVAYQHFKICTGLQGTGNNEELIADIEEIAAPLLDAAELDDTARAIDFLQSFVAGHEKFFSRESENENGKIESISPWTAESYGKIFANGEVAFLPHALKKILEVDGGFTSADKIFAELRAQDKLIYDAGRHTHKITLGEGRPRTIHFKANVIVTNKESSQLDYYHGLGVV